MIEPGLFNALTARDLLGDQVLEAYLIGKPGPMGLISFRNFAQNAADNIKKLEASENDSRRYLDALKNGVRVWKKKAPSDAVSTEEIVALTQYLDDALNDNRSDTGASFGGRVISDSGGATSTAQDQLWAAAERAYISANPAVDATDNAVLQFATDKINT